MTKRRRVHSLNAGPSAVVTPGTVDPDRSLNIAPTLVRSWTFSMPTSPCKGYPRICNKSGPQPLRPRRLFRAANDNRHDADHLFVADPGSTTASLPRARMPAIEIGSALSMVGLVILATHLEIEAIAGTLLQAVDGLLLEASSILW